LLSGAAVAAAWAADFASACPSCASPLEENRQAFVDTTIFLTLLPLIMVGTFVWWIRRRTRQADQAPEIPLISADPGRFSKRP
jgi:hypothetical protein